MNLDDDDLIAGRWSQIRSRLRDTWGRLSDEDLARENGDRDYIINKVQEHYGYSRQQAEQLVRDFEHTLQSPPAT